MRMIRRGRDEGWEDYWRQRLKEEDSEILEGRRKFELSSGILREGKF